MVITPLLRVNSKKEVGNSNIKGGVQYPFPWWYLKIKFMQFVRTFFYRSHRVKWIFFCRSWGNNIIARHATSTILCRTWMRERISPQNSNAWGRDFRSSCLDPYADEYGIIACCFPHRWEIDYDIGWGWWAMIEPHTSCVPMRTRWTTTAITVPQLKRSCKMEWKPKKSKTHQYSRDGREFATSWNCDRDEYEKE